MTTDTIEKPSTALVSVFDNPTLAVVETGYFDKVYAELKREADAITLDLSTEKGRKAIAAMAFKIARTKTAIDDAGKTLNEEARAKINAVDAARRVVRERLDALKDAVRAPLTDWENEEKARAERVELCMSWLRSAALVSATDTADTITAQIAEIRALEIGDDFGAAKAIAEGARDYAIQSNEAGLVRIAKEEADRAELDKLRAEAAARQEREAEAARVKAQAEADARAKQEAADRAAKAETARLEAIANAANAARLEAEQAAETERKRVEAAHAAEIAAERAKAAQIAREAEQAAAAKAEQERRAAAEAAAAAAAEALRVKNRAHRSAIMGEVKAAIMSCGIDEATAKNVVLAIVAGQIPHTAIQF